MRTASIDHYREYLCCWSLKWVVAFTGQVLTYDNIREVIKFCAREKLVVFADEVYQETIFTNEVHFYSCKKVLRDLGPEYNKFQLMSINSVSKGFYGEYVHGFKTKVMNKAARLIQCRNFSFARHQHDRPQEGRAEHPPSRFLTRQWGITVQGREGRTYV